MIIKGKSRAGASSLAHHLGNAEKNERVQLLEARGVIAQDLRGALAEMEAIASGTRCSKPLYHAAISPEPPHRLTPEQRKESIDALERKLGLEGHQRVVVLHEKLGREHVHVVWSRIDIKTMRSVHDGHNYRKHEEVSRDLERRFGHDRVQGAHAEREGPDGKVRRPDRTPSRAELRQEERTGIKGRDVKAEVTAAFRASDGPEAFRASLAERGYQLAQGDRRDFVIVDRAGGVHSLARRIDGVNAAGLRDFMAPLDRASLPTADEAKQIAEDRMRRLQEARDEKAYSRGGDYVSQSQAAQRDHERRQAKLDKAAGKDPTWDQIETGEAQRRKIPDGSSESYADRMEQRRAKERQESDEPVRESSDSSPLDNIEMTDAMQARLERLREYKAGLTSPARDGPGRQDGAPGGGRTRSR
jgi:hypothetical protein